jgi:hypothetical protein
MTSIDDTLRNYAEYKIKQDLIEKKMVKLRKQLKDVVSSMPDKKYQNQQHCVSIVSSKRSGISKKDVPSDVWGKYSVTTKFEMLVVRKKPN